jgi:hypothetical protein
MEGRVPIRSTSHWIVSIHFLISQTGPKFELEFPEAVTRSCQVGVRRSSPSRPDPPEVVRILNNSCFNSATSRRDVRKSYSNPSKIREISTGDLDEVAYI